MVPRGGRADDGSMAPTTTSTTPPPPSAPPPPFGRDHRRLRRSTTDRHLGGVAGGVAEHLGIEANVVRVGLAVAAAFSFGFVLVAYVAAWLLLPDTEDDEPIAFRWYREHGPRSDRPVATLLLVVLGVLVASGAWSIATDELADGPFRGIFLIGVIVALATSHRRSRHDGSGGPGPHDHRPPPPGPGWTAGTDDTVVDGRTTGATTGVDSEGPTAVEPWADPTALVGDEAPSPSDLASPLPHWSEDPTASTAVSASVPTAGAPGPARGRRSPTAIARRRRHRLVRNFFLLAVIEGAAVTGGLWASGWVRIPGWVVPATVLAVALVGLASAPVWGWSWALTGLAVLTLPFLLLAAVPGVTLRGGMGYRHDRPTAAADLPDSYRVGAGHQDLDLTDLDLVAGSRTVVHVETGIGATDVRVPAGADLELRGHLGGGSVSVDGEPAGIDGTDVHFRRSYPASTGARPRRSGAGTVTRSRPTLVIAADLGLGTLSVDRSA